MIYDVVDAPDI